MLSRLVANELKTVTFFFKTFSNKKGAYRSTLSYLNYEVTTNYLNIIESPTEFPAISICNLNPYDFTENNE